VPPAVDVQTWRADYALEENAPWMVGAAGAYSNGLLYASDSDEAWAVSEHLVDVVPFGVYRWRRLELGAELPARIEWDGQLGLADPRFSLWAGPVRVGVIAPWGTGGWPFSWDDYRGEVEVRHAGERWLAGALLSYGETGAYASAHIGARVGAYSLQVVGSRSWTELPVTAAEVRLGWTWESLRAWVASGVLPGVGSPRARVGASWLYSAQYDDSEDTAVLRLVVDDAPAVDTATDTASGPDTAGAVDLPAAEDHMEPTATATPTAPVTAPAAPAPEVAPVAPFAQPSPVPAPAPVETTATTAEPAGPSADDLAKLTEAAGGNAGLAAILALLAVAGSAGALKLYKGWSDNKKEVELARIQADAEARKGPDYSTQQPPPCAVKAAETEARLASLHKDVSELSARLDKVAKKADALPVGFDGDELEERIVKLEKAAKAKKG
jgi:hypothetical protein